MGRPPPRLPRCARLASARARRTAREPSRPVPPQNVATLVPPQSVATPFAIWRRCSHPGARRDHVHHEAVTGHPPACTCAGAGRGRPGGAGAAVGLIRGHAQGRREEAASCTPSRGRKPRSYESDTTFCRAARSTAKAALASSSARCVGTAAPARCASVASLYVSSDGHACLANGSVS